MAGLQVKPTRMELTNLKKRLKVAIRGHKMMKDKRDELVRRFIVLARKNSDLRQAAEQKLALAMQRFVLARACMSEAELYEAFQIPARSIAVEAGLQSVLSVEIPKLTLLPVKDFSYSYGFATTAPDLDQAARDLSDVLPLLLELAEAEKATARLADEIEKTRRRVNSLEFVMIPRFKETIRMIQNKLDENERGNLIRLMKTKEMLAEKA